jgi:hypothetical protein
MSSKVKWGIIIFYWSITFLRNLRDFCSIYSTGVSHFYVISEMFVPFILPWHKFQLPYWYESGCRIRNHSRTAHCKWQCWLGWLVFCVQKAQRFKSRPEVAWLWLSRWLWRSFTLPEVYQSLTASEIRLTEALIFYNSLCYYCYSVPVTARSKA